MLCSVGSIWGCILTADDLHIAAAAVLIECMINWHWPLPLVSDLTGCYATGVQKLPILRECLTFEKFQSHIVFIFKIFCNKMIVKGIYFMPPNLLYVKAIVVCCSRTENTKHFIESKCQNNCWFVQCWKCVSLDVDTCACSSASCDLILLVYFIQDLYDLYIFDLCRYFS